MAVNGVYIVQGEMNQLVMMLKRSKRWQSQNPSEEDPIIRNFSDLRDVLNNISDLSDMAPNIFLSPFLDVIRSDNTSGPVTGMALSSIGKFLSYGLIDPSCLTATSAVENIANAVTHARFVGGDSTSDEVVLLRIIQVLRTLLLTPVGSLLTNESVCEIMQSCFRICFESRLSELLRKAAEHALCDMIQLLFTRLPTFTEDPRHPYIRKLQRLNMNMFDRGKRKKKSAKSSKKPPASTDPNSDQNPDSVLTAMAPGPNNSTPETIIPSTEVDISSPVDAQGQEDRPTFISLASSDAIDTTIESPPPPGEIGSLGAAGVGPPADPVVFDMHGGLGFDRPGDDVASDDDVTGSRQDVSLPPSHQLKSVHSEESDLSRGAVTVEPLGQAISGVEGTVLMGQEGGLGFEGEPGVQAGSVVSERNLSKEGSVDREHHTDDEEPSLLRPRQRVNQHGVKFSSETPPSADDLSGPLVPYGLPCVREVFRFLISLTSPLDKNNAEFMIAMGLNLITVALEAGADYLGNYTVLMPLVKNQLCRCLFDLLNTDKLPIYASALRVCFLLFEALRTHLKFQLEMYFTRLMDLVISENPKIPFEQREIALDALVQLWRIPGLVTELYLNYDCNLYCSNLFEEMTKLLSKNAFPVTGLHSTHILSLDALLTVVDTIEANCHYRMVSHRENGATGPQGASEKKGGGPQPFAVPPPASGYTVAKHMSNQNLVAASGGPGPDQQQQGPKNLTYSEALELPQVRPNRMPTAGKIPMHEDLVAQKKKKRILTVGTDLFNQNPGKGIAFLQDQGFFRTPLVLHEVVEWLKENPRLDKKLIGEYICNRKNAAVLDAFVKSFNFDGVRVDDAIRMFVECFRIPGEAPVISMLMEHFATHYYEANGEQFANKDATFLLGYSVLMLNTDQHNQNAKRLNVPMTADCFKKNLRGQNGGHDFEPELLEEIFNAIKKEEILMPSEQTGLIKENYLWEVLLRRGLTAEGVFIHSPSGLFDHDLFSLIWSPSVAAISYVFDKSTDDAIVRKALSGFRNCAAISAHYGMHDVFDNLIISLCKFSTLTSSATTDNPELLPIVFGENAKGQMAAKALFQLVHQHGDILREGWRNLLDCLLALYRARMLPKALTEAEDFASEKGVVSIIREKSRPVAKSESGIFSSLYSYFGSDGRDSKGPTAEEQEFSKVAHAIIAECSIHNIVSDSKYLTSEALAELIKAIILASTAQTVPEPVLPEANEYAVVFYLELLCSITLENKDRLTPFWKYLKSYFYGILTTYKKNYFLIERTVVGLLRLAVRILFREEMANEVLESMEMLLLLRSNGFARLSRQISSGLLELLRANAANIHSAAHWSMLFVLLEAAGAAAYPEPRKPPAAQLAVTMATDHVESHSDVECGHEKDADDLTHSDIDRGYISDPEAYERQGSRGCSLSPGLGKLSGSAEWQYVEHEDGQTVTKGINLEPPGANPAPGYSKASLILRRGLKWHDPESFAKCCDALQFVVRDAAHVTPANFEACVRCLRTFIEAAIDGGRNLARKASLEGGPVVRGGAKPVPKPRQQPPRGRASGRDGKSGSPGGKEGEQLTEEEAQAQALARRYLQLTFSLLDLTNTLHVKAAAIYRNWAISDASVDASPQALWAKCWCPLLQANARLCCDARKEVRTSALTSLQRSLLIPDLQQLTGDEWENCFRLVIFPLLAKLLDDTSSSLADIPIDQSSLEETRMRATNSLLCKVFLQHLTPLSGLPSFPALWLTVLDFMERYHAAGAELSEAIMESLKNLLLVMATARMFTAMPALYQLTHERLASFLPNLLDEVVKVHDSQSPAKEPKPNVDANAHPATSSSSEANQPVPMQQSPTIESSISTPSLSSSLPTSAPSPPTKPEPPPLEEVVIDSPAGRSVSPSRYSGIMRASQAQHRGSPGLFSQPDPDGPSQLILLPPTAPFAPPAPTSSQVVLHPPAIGGGQVIASGGESGVGSPSRQGYASSRPLDVGSSVVSEAAESVGQNVPYAQNPLMSHVTSYGSPSRSIYAPPLVVNPSGNIASYFQTTGLVPQSSVGNPMLAGLQAYPGFHGNGQSSSGFHGNGQSAMVAPGGGVLESPQLVYQGSLPLSFPSDPARGPPGQFLPGTGGPMPQSYSASPPRSLGGEHQHSQH